MLFEKTKLAKLKDDIVSEIKTEIKAVINAKFELSKHLGTGVIRRMH